MQSLDNQVMANSNTLAPLLYEIVLAIHSPEDLCHASAGQAGFKDGVGNEIENRHVPTMYST